MSISERGWQIIRAFSGDARHLGSAEILQRRITADAASINTEMLCVCVCARARVRACVF
jgi:hypothetical protein